MSSDLQTYVAVSLGVSLTIACLLGAISASIASRKGHSSWAFFWFGFFFPPFALTTAYLIDAIPGRPVVRAPTGVGMSAAAGRRLLGGLVVVTVLVVAFAVYVLALG